MADVCSTCGLPKDLCVCGTISMEQQTVKVRMEMRKWGKPATIVEGIDGKSVDLSDLATKLKTYCACGGTSKNNSIILQGDHRDKVKKVLVGYGFPETSIELHQAAYLSSVIDVFRSLRRGSRGPPSCPNCGAPVKRSGSPLEGWVMPLRYLCKKCGYYGFLVMEKDVVISDRNEHQHFLESFTVESSTARFGPSSKVNLDAHPDTAGTQVSNFEWTPPLEYPVAVK